MSSFFLLCFLACCIFALAGATNPEAQQPAQNNDAPASKLQCEACHPSSDGAAASLRGTPAVCLKCSPASKPEEKNHCAQVETSEVLDNLLPSSAPAGSNYQVVMIPPDRHGCNYWRKVYIDMSAFTALTNPGSQEFRQVPQDQD